MSSEKKQVFLAAGIVGGGTLFSRITGFIRDIFIAAFFGASFSADAFFVAYRIPNLFRRLLAEGSLSIAFIPVFTMILEKNGKDEAFVFARSALRLLFFILIGLSILGVLFAPFIVKIIAPGFSSFPEKMELSILLTRLLFPYILFISLTAFFVGILNSLGHFAAPAFSQALLNIAMIFTLLLFANFLNPPVLALAIGVILGGFMQLFVLFPFLWKRGFYLLRKTPLWHKELTRLFLLMLPSVFGAAVYQLNVVINTLIASFLEEGSVSYLYYADRLVQFPLAIFGISAAMAILPVLSRQLVNKRMEDFKELFKEAVCWILFLNLPAMAGLMALSYPLIAFLFQRGAFDALSVYGSARALFYYSFGLWAFACVRVLVSVFYAMQDTKTPVVIAVISFTLSIIFSLFLIRPLSYAGLALATSLGSIVNFTFLALILSKKIKGLFSPYIFKSAFISLFNAAFMGLSVYFLDSFLALQFGTGTFFLGIRLIIGIFFGVFLYVFLAYIFKSPELSFTLTWILRKKNKERS